MNVKKIILNSLLLTVFVLTANAQAAFSSAGGDSSGTGGSVSFTTGITSFTTHTGTTGSVAQGVQQPYEISLVTGIEKPDDISLSVTVFPNPATDFLILKINSSSYFNSWYQLYDVNGNIIESKKIVSDLTNITVGNLTSATYFLKIIDNKAGIKIFKFIKN
jgi:hypothetical protein